MSDFNKIKKGEEKAFNSVKNIAKPIFDKVLKEINFNHRQDGSSDKEKPFTFYAQPHDYRLYFDFSKTNFNPDKLDNLTFTRVLKREGISPISNDYTIKPRNYNSEYHFKNFNWCGIKVRKNTIEITNHKIGKQWIEIKGGTIEEINDKFDNLKENLDKHCIETLKSLIKIHGGKSELKILRERGEIGFHGDDYLDNIPDELVVRDTFFKKLYKKKVEFYTIPHLKNYISNRAIEQISPEIAESINGLGNTIMEELNPSITELNKSIQLEIKNKKLHLSVLKGIEGAFNKFNNRIDQMIPQSKKPKKSKEKRKYGLSDKEIETIKRC